MSDGHNSWGDMEPQRAPINNIIRGVDCALRIGKVFVQTGASVLAMLGVMAAFIASMFWFADLVHNEAGIFIPIVALLFVVVFGLIWRASR